MKTTSLLALIVTILSLSVYSSAARSAEYCDTETTVFGPTEVGNNLDYSVNVRNDDCGVQDPATWGSTFVELYRFAKVIEVLQETCFDLVPDEVGYYDATALFNYAAGIDKRGVYQVRARPYSNNDCTGDRGPIGSDTFNVADPSLSSATFLTQVTFFDSNPTDVDVSINCTTGLPISQQSTINRIQPVNFVVDSFASGELTCTIVGEDIPGYVALHGDGQDEDSSSCRFSNVEQGSAWGCLINYELQTIDVEVSKVWLFDGARNDISEVASATLSCQNILVNVFAGPTSASYDLNFNGDETKSVAILPYHGGTSVCSVNEVDKYDSFVETDDSDCQGLQLLLGDETVTCTIVNTVFFEGIPVLNRNGIVLLIVLLAGTAWFGFRRFG